MKRFRHSSLIKYLGFFPNTYKFLPFSDDNSHVHRQQQIGKAVNPPLESIPRGAAAASQPFRPASAKSMWSTGRKKQNDCPPREVHPTFLRCRPHSRPGRKNQYRKILSPRILDTHVRPSITRPKTTGVVLVPFLVPPHQHGNRDKEREKVDKIKAIIKNFIAYYLHVWNLVLAAPTVCRRDETGRNVCPISQ